MRREQLVSAALSLVALALRCIYTPHALHIYSCYYMMRPYNTTIYTALYIPYIHPLYMPLYIPLIYSPIYACFYGAYFQPIIPALFPGLYWTPLYPALFFTMLWKSADFWNKKQRINKYFAIHCHFWKSRIWKTALLFQTKPLFFPNFFRRKFPNLYSGN